MKAVVLDGYGDADKLTVREIPRPACGDGQVTVQVRAAGVNPIDWRLRKGSLRWMLPARFPLVLGFDVAGEIVEVGAAVGEWKLGDEVLCFLDSRHGGGYAEYAVAGADVLAPKPTAVSFAEAAGVPLAASTALQALRDVGKVATGRQLLVNGAAGGVGNFAVQLGRILGARVTGTCSESNLEFVRELGAERVMDYARQDFAAQEQGYDVIFDAVAKSSFWKCRTALKPGGCYITTVPSPQSLFFRSITWYGRRCRNILVRPAGDDLRFLAERMNDGELRSPIEQVYTLSEAATAHRVSEAGHVRGKLVLSVEASNSTPDQQTNLK